MCKSERYFLILLVLFVAWMCVGIFPLQCYETDGNEIILGCDVMYRNGWSFPPVYSYEYRMQPLITILIVALKHLLPFLTCEQIYCILTVVSSFVFLAGCITFARQITQASKTRILIAAILLPEMYAIAMYPNTAIPSVACFLWALILMGRQRYWQSGVLMCLAILFRLDIVIVFPAILPLLIYQGKSLRQTIQTSAVYAVIVVAAALFLFWVMRADALNTYGSYQQWNHIITPIERILAIFGFYSLTYLILLPIGLCVIIAQRRWKELFLVLFPILLLHGIYASFGNASKHFLYNAPFVIIAGVRALSWLEDTLRRRPVLKWTALVLAVLLMTVSLRKRSVDMPWLQTCPLQQAGMVLPLYTTQTAAAEVTLGIGAGYQLLTNDEAMLASGHLFYTWYIHQFKSALGEWRAQQKAVLDRVGTAHILTFEWGASAPVAFDQMTDESRFRQLDAMPEDYRFTLSDPRRDLHFWRVVLYEGVKDREQIESYIDRLSSKITTGPKYVVAATPTAHILDEIALTGKLTKKADRLYQLNE